MMRRAQLCLRLALVVSAILAGLLFAQFAYAQSALEYAASGMGSTRVSEVRAGYGKSAINRRFSRRLVASEGVLAVAQRYLGSHRFTPHARAWCADAMNAWLQMAGYSGTGDGRAISFARYGRPSGPRVSAIAVMRHHVGIVADVTSRGVVLVSGNHSRKVGVGVYSARRIIAYREPV